MYQYEIEALEEGLRESIKFNAHRFQESEGDMDYRTYQRSFSGRMTKKRYEIIDRFCRLQSFRQHCGCEGDCCGHLCGQSLDFTYKLNQVTITLSQSFNY